MRNTKLLFMAGIVGFLSIGAVLSPSRPVSAQAASAVKKLEYKDIITAEAKTRKGLFDIHQVGGKYYFEIPEAVFGKDILWWAELEKMPEGVGARIGTQVGVALVRLERTSSKVYVRAYSLKNRSAALEPQGNPADGEQWNPIGQAVGESAFAPVILSLEVLAEGPNRSAIVDVTNTFCSDQVPDVSPKDAMELSGYVVAAVDLSASYVQDMKSYPRNVGIRTHITYNLAKGPSTSRASIVLYNSLTLLPDEPMMPRYFDSRVGYFAVDFQDYSGKADHGVVKREIICRYRLEKKDPQAAISEPVKPIVYYVSREVPEKWRKYIKQAIEDWQPAFEAAGFKNAIIAKDAPTLQEDPDWDPADTRHSVIRWLAQPTANAMGPNTHDPRTGEIISAHVYMWHDVLSLLQQWYFTRCATLDARARKLPLPDELMGELLRYATCHEVGHSMGLRHNHRASQVYTVKELRDPEFARIHGPVASVMSYGRFNYIAQPEDGVKQLLPMLGPYDSFAIHWGYGTIPNVKSPDDEVATLDLWAGKQAGDRMLAFGGEDEASTVDPNVLIQNIGADRVESTRMGLKNLDKTSQMEFLVAAATRKGEDYSRLRQVYEWLLNRRYELLQSVTELVGGVEETRTLAGRGGAQFHRVPKARQREAVQFVLNYGLKDFGPLADPKLLNLISPKNATVPFVIIQQTLIGNLLDEQRYIELQDGVVLEPANSYSIGGLLTDVQKGVYDELDAANPKINPLRQSLQRNFIEHLNTQLNKEHTGTLGSAVWTEFRPAALSTLQAISAKISAVIPKVTDASTRAHLQYCKGRIQAITK